MRLYKLKDTYFQLPANECLKTLELQIIVRFFGDYISRAVIEPFSALVDRVFASSLACGVGYLIVASAIAAFMIVDSWDSPERLTSASGILVWLVFGFVFSAHPGHVRWRHIVWGIGIEFLLGLAVLRWDVSRYYDLFISYIIACLSDVFV